MYGKQMLTWLGYIDGKCYHIYHTYGSYGNSNSHNEPAMVSKVSNHQPVIITRQFFFQEIVQRFAGRKIGVECGTHRMSIHKIIEKILALFGLQITIYGQLLGVEMLPISTNLWSTTMQWCSSKCLFQNSAVILLGHPALIKRLFCRDCNAWLPTVGHGPS